MKQQNNHGKQKILWIATIVLIAVFLAAFCMFLVETCSVAREEQAFAELSALVVRNTVAPKPVETVAPTAIRAESSPAVRIEPTSTPAPLADYEALYERNPDFFGWISVEGTNVDYPVMYCPNDPLRYLGHDFDRKPSYAGVPYLDADCDPDGTYWLVYGHHMRNGTMFAGLMAYEDEAFRAEHPTFRFDTRFERRTYAVIAAFRARVLTEKETGFRYYSYTQLDDEKTFDTFMTNIRAAAAYDTGVQTAFGDEILTLSTCAYHTEKGRFVVVAKRID